MQKLIIKCTFILALPVILLSPGCASYSTFQTPEVLEPGEKTLGIGYTVGINSETGENSGDMLEAFGRYGIKQNWDIGMKVAGAPPLWGVYIADVKYQLKSEPLFVAADIGISYSKLEGIFEDTDIITWGLYPMIIAGTKHVHAGVKLVYMNTSGEIDMFGSSTPFKGSATFPGLFLGFRIGNKYRLMPELNVYFPSGKDSEPFKVGGICFQFAF
jgi:hypothetical protein